MSHYEQRLEHDLQYIRTRTRRLSDLTLAALRDAVQSLLGGNRELAYKTVLGDARINQSMREIDGLCHRFIARHLPSAGHLRLMSAVMRTALQLERIGDYAVTVAREGVQLSAAPDGAIARQLELVADQATRMLEQAVAAFNTGNADAARSAMDMGGSMEGAMDHIYGDMMSTSQGPRVKDLMALFVVFSLLKRVSDQAKNILEETVFAIAGETKAGRVHDVLFIDEDNTCLSQMAAAIASRNHAGAARFASAGATPGEHVDADLREFMADHGHDLSDAGTQALDASEDALSRYFVVVCLQGPAAGYLSRVPFHTSVLEWDVGERPAPGDARRYEELYRELSSQIGNLVDALTGTGAE